MLDEARREVEVCRDEANILADSGNREWARESAQDVQEWLEDIDSLAAFINSVAGSS